MLGTSAEGSGEPGHQQESRDAEEASAQAGSVLCCVAEIDCRPPIVRASLSSHCKFSYALKCQSYRGSTKA